MLRTIGSITFYIISVISIFVSAVNALVTPFFMGTSVERTILFMCITVGSCLLIGLIAMIIGLAISGFRQWRMITGIVMTSAASLSISLSILLVPLIGWDGLVSIVKGLLEGDRILWFIFGYLLLLLSVGIYLIRSSLLSFVALRMRKL